MKAVEASLLSFLQRSPQFIIPIYQRTYSWTEKQCRQLWDDILRVGSSDTIAVHFVGSIVYIEQEFVAGLAPGTPARYRWAATSDHGVLLLEALARALEAGEPVEDFSAIKVRHYFLSNPLEDGDRYYKLLAVTDRQRLAQGHHQKRRAAQGAVPAGDE